MVTFRRHLLIFALLLWGIGQHTKENSLYDRLFWLEIAGCNSRGNEGMLINLETAAEGDEGKKPCPHSP